MKKLILFPLLFSCVLVSAQENKFPLFSSGTYSGGSTSDLTDITNAQLKLQSTTGYIRVPHLSENPTVSAVYNYQTGKNAYWGESSDVGSYFFRGRNLIVDNGKLGIGTASPADQLEVINGNRKVGINTIIPGVANGGVIALSRGDDGLKTMFIGSSAAPTDDNVIFSQGGGTELRLVSYGGAGPNGGIGFYANMPIQSAFGSARPAAAIKITGDGNVGIGTTSPQSKLDVFSPAALESTAGSSVLLNRFYSVAGGGGNYFSDNSWLYRDAEGTNWLTARLHKGISIDGSYTAPGVSTRTWWERDPFNGIQSWGDMNQTHLTINQGNVGIGTTSPDAKLAVKGTIHSQEVKVDLNVPGPDYVFEENYNLQSLTEVENYIKQNKHLPEVPSAKEMKTNGINLSEMNMLLLKKVEELTLYVIELKKEVEVLKKNID